MKILIVGLGSIASMHINAIKLINSEVLIYALRSSPSGANIDGVTNLYQLGDMQHLKFDGAIISNPSSLHFDTIKKLLPLRIPLFIEKPVLSALRDSTSLKDEIANNNILTYVGCNLRFLESLEYFKDNIIKNIYSKINEINIYAGSYLPDWHPLTNYHNNYSSLPELGGGVHLDLIHEIDYVYWLLGPPIHSYSYLRSKSSLKIKSIDFAHYILEYTTFSVNITLNYYRRDQKRHAEFVLSDETIILDLLANNIINHSGKSYFKSSQNMSNTYLCQMNYFMNLIKENRNHSINSFDDGINVLKIALNE